MSLFTLKKGLLFSNSKSSTSIHKKKMIIVVNTFYIHNFPLHCHCHCHYTVKPRTGSEIHVLYSGSHSIYKTITTNHTVAVCIYVGLNVGYIVNKQCVGRKI